MAKLASKQPLQVHPEVPLGQDAEYITCHDTMLAMAGVRASESISYYESPYVFGDLTLNISSNGVIRMTPDKSAWHKYHFVFEEASTVSELLDIVIKAADQSHNLWTLPQVANICRALQAIYHDAPIQPVRTAFHAFNRRNAAWRDR